MRPVGSIIDHVIWRAGVARSGFGLRLRALFSFLIVFGGIGVAIGYAVVGRVMGASDDDDEAETRPIAE